jgi:hypothetical protein
MALLIDITEARFKTAANHAVIDYVPAPIPLPIATSAAG